MALVLKDSVEEIEQHDILTVADIHSGLKESNKEQIELALIGYQTVPKKVVAVVIPEEQENYSEAMNYLEAIRWDYLVIHEIEQKDVSTFATWIKALDKKVKAVLPHYKADHERIIKFTSENIVTNEKTYTTAEYCSRIAGLLTGTPMTISAIFAPLSEVVDFDRKTKAEMDEAINDGGINMKIRFILI